MALIPDLTAEITAFKNAVYGEDVRDAMVSLANKMVNWSENSSGMITTNMLADLCVTTIKLADGSVDYTKIKDNSVSTAHLQTSSVTSNELANNSVTGSKIANGSITNEKIMNGSITNEKLANETLSASKIASNSITDDKLVNSEGSIKNTVSKLASNKVPYPIDANDPDYGNSGQILSSNGDGTTFWKDELVPSIDVVDSIIDEWLSNHPEATTTVQDGSVESTKLTSSFNSKIARIYATVADMKADTTLVAGLICRTLGFRSINDDGGAWYSITSSGTANEMDVISCGSLYANYMPMRVVSVKQLGAYGDGTHDDSTYFERARLLTFGTKYILYSPPGWSYGGNIVIVGPRATIELHGSFTNLTIKGSSSGANGSYIYVDTATNLTISNYKNCKWEFNTITNLTVSADRTSSSSGSTSYITATAKWISNLTFVEIDGETYTGAWLTSVYFHHFRCANITFQGDTYSMNDVRVEDIIMEGGTITFNKCKNCFVSGRGEGESVKGDAIGYNIAYLNDLSQGLSRYDINAIPGTGIITVPFGEEYTYVDCQLDINSKNTYTEATNGTFVLGAWSYIGEIRVLLSKTIQIFARANIRCMRGSCHVEDESGTWINPGDVDDYPYIVRRGQSYDATTGNVYFDANVGESCVTYAPNGTDSTYYVVFNMRLGGGTHTLKRLTMGCKTFDGKPLNDVVCRRLVRGMQCSSIPASTLYPVGTTVFNTGDNKLYVCTNQTNGTWLAVN